MGWDDDRDKRRTAARISHLQYRTDSRTGSVRLTTSGPQQVCDPARTPAVLLHWRNVVGTSECLTSGDYRDVWGATMRRDRVWWFGAGGLVTCLIAMLYLGSPQSFRRLGVPVLVPNLADFRIITEGARCTDLGFDPLVENPCDPWGRPMNYPRIWLDVVELFGRSPNVAVPVGVCLWLLVMTLLFARARWDLPKLGMFVLAVFNPATFLLIERGNIDVFIAALVGGAALMLGQRGRWSFAAGAGFVAAASILKVYPVVLLLPLALVAVHGDTSQRRYRFGVTALSAIGTVLYFLVTLDDLATINEVTPKPASYGYGFLSLLLVLRHQWPIFQLTPGLFLAPLAALLVVLVVSGRALGRGWPSYRVAVRAAVSSPSHIAVLVTATAVAGTLVYANFPYRLVLVSLLVASLAGLGEGSRSHVSLVGWAIGLSLLAPWLIPLTRGRLRTPMNLGTMSVELAVTCGVICSVALIASTVSGDR